MYSIKQTYYETSSVWISQLNSILTIVILWKKIIVVLYIACYLFNYKNIKYTHDLSLLFWKNETSKFNICNKYLDVKWHYNFHTTSRQTLTNTILKDEIKIMDDAFEIKKKNKF